MTIAAVDWDLFKWIVTALLTTITALVAALFLSLQSEITKMDAKIDGAIAAGHANNIELIRAVATLTGKVEQLSDDIKRK